LYENFLEVQAKRGEFREMFRYKVRQTTRIISQGNWVRERRLDFGASTFGASAPCGGAGGRSPRPKLTLRPNRTEADDSQ